MNSIHKISVITALIASLVTLPCIADITHTGTVSVIRNHAASADSGFTESWTWAQLSGLIGSSACTSGDDGAGDLAYLATADEEQFMGSMLLTAYLSGQPVTATIDDVNLYQGKCRLKQVKFAPEIIVPDILKMDNPALKLAYTMDNVDGTTLVDESAQGANGTIVGATQVAGKFGNALAFDGTTSTRVTLPSGLGDSFPVAFSFWIKRSAGAGGYVFQTSDFNDAGSTYKGLALYVADSGKLTAHAGGGGSCACSYNRKSAATSDGALGDDAFHHVLVNMTSLGNYQIYVDGVSQSLTASGTGTSYEPGSGGGELSRVSSTPFDGIVDQVRVFNRVLTAEEVLDLYEE